MFFNICGLKVLNYSEIFVLFYKYLKKIKRKLYVIILKVEINWVKIIYYMLF